jgi:hypothetical protein
MTVFATYTVSSFCSAVVVEDTMKQIALFLDKEKEKAKKHGDTISDICMTSLTTNVSNSIVVFYDVTLNKDNQKVRTYGPKKIKAEKGEHSEL